MSEIFQQKLDRATKLQLHETQYIISNICEEIQQNFVSPKYALQEIRKKMFSSSPHESHTALFVLESVVKNCGSVVHDEILEENNCAMFAELVATTPYENVKSKMLRLLQSWAFTFKTADKYNALEELVDTLQDQGYTFPEMVDSDAIFLTQPENIESCHHCHTSLIYLQSKKQCRKCGQFFCGRCTLKKSFPKYGIKNEVRICEHCCSALAKITRIPSSRSLSTLTNLGSNGQLNQALPTKKSAVEKFALPESKIKHNSEMENMYNTGRFSDIKLVVDGREIKAHKIILAEQSPTFNEKLSTTDSNTIEIKDMDYETTHQILNFIYKDKVDNITNNIDNLISASEKYGLNRLKKLCERTLYENLSVENALKTLLLANVNNSTELKEETVSFIKKNIKEIIKSPDWNEFCTKNSELFNQIFISWINYSKRSFIMNNIKRSIEQPCPKEINPSKEIIENLEKLFECKKFVDFTIKVGNKKIKTHKIILFNRSTFFAEMFNHESSQENSKNFLEIKDFDYETIHEMIRFMYYGHVEGLSQIAIKLLPAADKYKLKNLVDICENALLENMSLSNVMQILKISELHHVIELKHHAIKFMRSNIFALTVTPEWKEFAEHNSNLINEILKMWALD